MADLEKRWEGELSAVTNTPRTDAGEWPSPDRAQEITFEGRGCVVMSPEEYGALHEHARQLERENADLTAKLAAARKAIIEMDRLVCMRRVWGGMDWSWDSPHAKRAHETARTAMATIDASISEAAIPPAPGPTTP